MTYACRATLVPLGRPVTMLDTGGREYTRSYDEHTFDAQSSNPGNIKLCVGHDRELKVGKLDLLIPYGGWWRCTFRVDADLGDELKVGQPVSLGLQIMPSGNPVISEVSLVSSGRVPGAKLTHREPLRPRHRQ